MALPELRNPDLVPLTLAIVLLGVLLALLSVTRQGGRGITAPDLELRVVPRKAVLRLDGRSVGRGRARLEVKPGRHTVSARLDGYESQERTVRVTPSAGVLVSLRLAARPGTVQLEVRGPKRYTVTNGSEQWKNPHEISLDPGRYLLTVTAEGYRPQSRQVQLAPGRRHKLRIRLTSFPDVPAQPPLPPRRLPQNRPRWEPRPLPAAPPRRPRQAAPPRRPAPRRPAPLRLPTPTVTPVTPVRTRLQPGPVFTPVPPP